MLRIGHSTACLLALVAAGLASETALAAGHHGATRGAGTLPQGGHALHIGTGRPSARLPAASGTLPAAGARFFAPTGDAAFAVRDGNGYSSLGRPAYFASGNGNRHKYLGHGVYGYGFAPGYAYGYGAAISLPVDASTYFRSFDPCTDVGDRTRATVLRRWRDRYEACTGGQ